MDFVTRQFIVLAKKLRDDARKALSALHTDFQQHNETVRRHYETTDKKQDSQSHIHVFAELRAPENVERQRTDNENRNYGVQKSLKGATWATFIATSATFIAVAFYGGVTYFQWKEMRRATNNAKEAFKTEAKAHIVVTNVRWRASRGNPPKAVDKICPDDGVKQHICIEMDFDNGGRTPAPETHTTVHVVPPSDILRAREIIDKFTVAPLGEPQGRDPVSVGSHEWAESSLEEICESVECIRPIDAHNMVEGKTPIYIYGAIQYRDVFGEQHATRFCFFRPPINCPPWPGGCLDSCQFGNWLDRPRDIPPPKD